MRLLIQLYSRLPLAVHYALAWPIYFLSYHVVGFRKRDVRESLEAAFPELDKRERRQLEKRFYRFFSENVGETVKSLTMTGEQLKKHMTLENPELLAPYFERRQSLLFLSLHQCNVEWTVISMGSQMPCPMAGIYKPLHSTTMDELVLASRTRYGELIPIKRSSREILRQRRIYRGLMMIADQSPIHKEKRFWHPFMHRPAPFHYGPQSVAEMTDCPVIFVHPRRVGRGQYTLRFEILAEPPHTKSSTEILERFIDACERSIREQPETWWWLNRKWKSPKPGELEAFGLAPD